MPATTHSAQRRVLERLWIVGSVAYGGLRIFIADHTVRRYGVNIFAFAAVELGTSFVYGLATARVVGALVDRHRDALARWVPIALASFLAPEAFIVLTGHRMPRAVYLVVATIVVVMGSVATWSLVRKVRDERQHVEKPHKVKGTHVR